MFYWIQLTLVHHNRAYIGP